MRDWLTADHPVWTVIDIIDRIDTTAFHKNAKTGGAGRAGYHPDMLLTLLVWAWSRGERSSRRIERLCTEDVAYRVICAQDIPDHVTIARFRTTHATACEDLFTQVLMLAAGLGLGRLETIALDSVKIASNAGTSANRTESSVRAEAAEAAEAARALAAAAVAAHEATDTSEDDEHGPDRPGPGSVPPPLADPRSRAARISEAIAVLDSARAAEQQARADKDTSARAYLEQAQSAAMPKGLPPASVAVAAAQLALEKALAAHAAKVARYEQRKAEAAAKGHKYGGWVIRPAEQDPKVIKARTRLARVTEAAKAAVAAHADPDIEDRSERVVNTTDPESGLQPLRGGNWLQGFNCQAVTSGDGVIMAVSVAVNPTDAPTFVPMMQAAVAAAETITAARTAGTGTDGEGIGVLLADAGYFSEANVTAPGPDRLIARGKGRYLEHAVRDTPTSGPPPAGASPVEAMAHRLRTEEGITTYRKRSHIAETPFGHAKHNLNFRRFTGRGLVRARGEWSFHAAVHNIGKILTLVGGGGLPATV
ncbi:transposase [Rhodococcus sp. NPDC060090]|uniref:transposase n=1 Tax=Rhodococcus sp. NPDC060090 TaxID=3347056 RepID=UPI00365C4B55